jgi:hypothetical protein
VPLRYQFPSLSKYEDAEIRCSRGLTQLRSDCPVKIGDDKYVAFGIARDFLRVIPRLKPFCLFTNAVPNERSRHPAPYCHVSAGEMNNGNHSVSRIAETKIWNMVAHGARLFAISTRRQHDDGHVSIGCGKFVGLEIDKANRIGVAG